MRKTIVALAIVSILFSLSLKGEAVDLKGRVGLGYSALSPLSGWSIRYWLTENLAVNGIIDFHFETDNNEFLLGGRALYKVRDEKNLNLYLGGEIGADFRENRDDNFSIGPFAGAELFLNGLPNLGVGGEIGAYYQSAAKSFATAFGRLVMHYYFGAPREAEKPKEKQVKPAKKPAEKK